MRWCSLPRQVQCLMNLTNYGDNHSRSDWLAAWGIADGRCWPFIIFARNWEHHLKTQAISGVLVVKKRSSPPAAIWHRRSRVYGRGTHRVRACSQDCAGLGYIVETAPISSKGHFLPSISGFSLKEKKLKSHCHVLGGTGRKGTESRRG